MSNRETYLLSKYGITPAQWDRLYAYQAGKCPICHGKLYRPDNPEGKRAAAVDHDHKTKVVRGLVCHNCNRHRIGKNDIQTSLNLVAYLQSGIDGRSI